MEQNFADKLRDIANQESENDEALIQKINSIFDRYVPELKEKIPEGIQSDLIKSAKKKQHKMTISISDYLPRGLSNEKTIPINDCKKDIDVLNNIFTQGQSNSLVNYENFDGIQCLEYKAYGDQYRIHRGESILFFLIVLGADSLAKVLKNEGFEVSVLSPKKLRVKW